MARPNVLLGRLGVGGFDDLTDPLAGGAANLDGRGLANGVFRSIRDDLGRLGRAFLTASFASASRFLVRSVAAKRHGMPLSLLGAVQSHMRPSRAGPGCTSRARRSVATSPDTSRPVVTHSRKRRIGRW